MAAGRPQYTRLQNEDELNEDNDTGGDLPLSHVVCHPDVELQPTENTAKSGLEARVVSCQPDRMVIQPSGAAAPANYECISIVSLLFCVPMGICAIIYSHNSSLSANEGDFSEAKRKGNLARGIPFAAIILGILTIASVCVYHANILRLFQT